MPNAAFPVTPDVAADTGIHLGDGHLRIKRGGPHGAYEYDVTGNAVEDQLYLIGTVMPTVSSAYGLNSPGFYINPELTWISLRYQSKPVALFKHETLGLPSGRKRNLSIPQVLRSDSHLMRHLARELLATDGVLGFYSAGRNGLHKYPRIQIKLKACPLIAQLTNFLRHELGLHVSYHFHRPNHLDRKAGLQQILQINRSQDIDTWRREIGFSNPSHISRMMVFDLLGECAPRTSIRARLSLLCGRSSRLEAVEPIPPHDLISIVDQMRKSFRFPRLEGKEILHKALEVSERLGSSPGRRLPPL